jgi:ankyrin repeat protein
MMGKADDEERRRDNLRFMAMHEAFIAGDLAAIRAGLDDPADFPNCAMPFDGAMGEHPLSYAIGWAPLTMMRTLLELGADPNKPVQDGFPSLIEALSLRRADNVERVRLLLDFGADVNQRGINDWTPLHYAVALRNGDAVRLLLERGADPALRTRIDECSTPLEDAEAHGFAEGAALIRAAAR